VSGTTVCGRGDGVVDTDDGGCACEGGIFRRGELAQAGEVAPRVASEEVVEEGSVTFGDRLVFSLCMCHSKY